jgi:tRNA-2-methylthio-N6-dimethylallyladenosine synthase
VLLQPQRLVRAPRAHESREPEGVRRAATPRTFHVWTIGCQMNVAESDAIATALQRRGLTHVPSMDGAELVVLNSCTVRESAEQRVQGTLGNLAHRKREDPDLMVALTGCSVEPDLDAMGQRLPMVDFFFQPGALDHFLGQLEAHEVVAAPGEPFEAASPHGHSSPVSTYVSVMQGCNKFCTYCIVPYRRGREVSRPIAEVVADARMMTRRGVKEITLLGQIIDHYGRDLSPKSHLADLMEAVHEVEGLERLRFMTSHPRDMDDRLIEAIARLPKVVETVHLPVQAGDDVVLRRMRRQYTVERYLGLVEKIRATIPGVAVTTDIIVGFCGETEEQFQGTLALMDAAQFDVVHAACYSPRHGTVSASWDDDVPQEEKEERRRRLERQQEETQARLNARLLDTVQEVLVEDSQSHRQDLPQWRGRTRANKLVFIPRGDEDLTGRTVRACITKTSPWALQGVIDS